MVLWLSQCINARLWYYRIVLEILSMPQGSCGHEKHTCPYILWQILKFKILRSGDTKTFIGALVDKWNIRPVYNYVASINLFPPIAAYMRKWIRSALIQIMACRVFGAKLLSKPCWVIVNWALGNKLHSRKCIRNHRPRNGGHFVQGTIS